MLDVLTNGIFLAVAARSLIGVSLVWDKVLLRRPATRNLPNYVFWLGAISVFGVLLTPFGFAMPALPMAGVGFGAGLVHLAANWFYYRALQRGEASESIPRARTNTEWRWQIAAPVRACGGLRQSGSKCRARPTLPGLA